jgi:dTDP-4-amino-4,6-dideoxygalactose transaminase
MSAPIPLVDLRAAHAEVAEEVDAGFKRVLANAAFVGGEEVAAFEREYAAFTGVPHVVGVANGTDALELALRAVGAGPGSEVVLPANTFVATAEAVARTGARVVLVDIDPDSYLIDVDAARAAVTPATRALVPVHLYGQLAPMERLVAALDGTGVSIVEDAAQCQGATRHGRQAGSWGVAATSFYPGKNLGAYGDAGAVSSMDPDLATTVRSLGNHGGLTKYRHDLVGCNSRLDGLQAVVLRAKLARLAAWNEARRAAAARYDALLAGLAGVVRPTTLPGNEHVWHLYVIQVPGDRDAVLHKLRAAGIGAGIHYPTPVHLTPAFAGLGHRPGDFPAAEAAAGRILSLPMYPQISAEQQERVVEVLATALGEGSSAG